MADNTELDAGSGGDTIASDDISGVKYQRVKIIEGADGTNDGDISSANPLPVQISDGTDTALVDGSGNVNVVESNSAAILADTADIPNVIGTDGAAGPTKAISIAGTESGGTLQELLSDSDGHLQVDVLSGGGGVSHTDDAAFTAGTDTVTPIAGFANDSAPDSVDEGDAGSIRMSLRREIYNQIRDAAGNERGANVDASNNLNVAETNSTDILTALQLIDNPVSGSEMLIAGGATQTNDVKVSLDGENVTETNSAAILADTAAIDTNAATIAGAVAAGQMQVDIVADGAGLATTANQSTLITNTTDIPNVIGTDGSAGPTKAISIAGTESGGTLQELLSDSDGHLQVDVLTGGGSGVTHTDDAAFTAGTDDVVPAAGFYDTSADALDDGDAGALRCSNRRVLYSQIRDAAGSERGVNVNASNQLSVIEPSAADALASLQTIDNAYSGNECYIAGGATQTNDVKVTLDSETVTVDGTVTANLSATDNTVLDAIDTNTDDIPNVIGTDGAAGPTKVISVGGTDGSGNLQELLTDTDGHLQIDVLSGGGSGTEYTEDAVSSGGEDGPLVLGVRQDADTSPVTATGDFHSLIFDATGNLKVNVKAGSSSGTEYTEDAVSSGGEDGPLVLGVRQDADTSPVNATGDFHSLIFDDAGNLKVNVKTGAAGGVTHTDDAAFTAGTDDVVPAAGVYQSSPDTVDDGDAGAVRMTATRAMMTCIETPNGDSAMDDTNDAVNVNVVAGSGSGVSHVDDAAFTVTSDDVVPAAGMFNDTSPDSVDEGDAGVVRMSANRNLYSTIRDALGNERGVAVNPSNELAVAETNSLTMTGYLSNLDDTVGTEGAALGRGMLLQGDDGTNRQNISCDATSGNLQIDVSSELPAGTQNIGDVDIATIAAGDNNIGNVDIASELPAGTQNIGDVDVATVPAPLNVIGGGTEAAALRVTIANNSTGVVTVDGTITETNSAAILADTATIDTNCATVAGAVAAGQMQVDVVAELPAGTQNIGDVDIASIAAGDNNIGNVDVATVPAPLSTTGNGTAATALRVTVASDTTGVLSVDDNSSSLSIDIGGTAPQLDDTDKIAVSLYGNDAAAGDTTVHVDAAGDVQCDVLSQPALDRTTDNVGVIQECENVAQDTTVRSVTRAAFTMSADGSIVAALGASNKCLVLALSLVADGDCDFTIKDGSGGTSLAGPYAFAGDAQPKGIALQYSPVGHMITTANTALHCDFGTTATTIGGHVVYATIQ